MRSLRPVSMVAWVFACHLRPCFGQLYQKEYTISARKSLMGKRALETNYFICQQCMIDAAGVAGIWMTHFSDRRNLAAFSITGTLRSFGRVHTYCEAYCDGLQELPPSPGMSTSDENLNRQEQNANLRASDQSNGRLLCLAQPQWSVSLSCRTCLKETSESVSFGEFYVVAGKDIRYVVYVLHSVRTRKQVYEPCITFGHCAAFNEEIYSEKVCERVHGSQALWYTEPIKSLEKAIASMKVSNDGQIEESPNGPESYTHFQCFKTTKRTDLRKLHQLILNCMKCLTKKFFGLVHCMTPGSTRDPDALFLIYFHEEMSVEVSSSQICRNKCPDFEPVETEECYKKYHFGFDWSPAENQMSVNVPELSRKNDHTVDGTLCVLAYSNTDIGACGACLNSQFKNEKHKARTLSKMNALIRIHAKKKTELAKCMGDSGEPCTGFLFPSTEVCKDEKFYPITSTHSSEDEKGFSIVANGFPAESSSQSNGKKTRLSILPDPSRVVTVVGVKYVHSNCLACLLMLYEVLLVSTEDEYLWMVEHEEPTVNCDCTWEKTGTRLEKFKMNPLRPVAGYGAEFCSDIDFASFHLVPTITKIEVDRLLIAAHQNRE